MAKILRKKGCDNETIYSSLQGIEHSSERKYQTIDFRIEEKKPKISEFNQLYFTRKTKIDHMVKNIRSSMDFYDAK